MAAKDTAEMRMCQGKRYGSSVRSVEHPFLGIDKWVNDIGVDTGATGPCKEIFWFMRTMQDRPTRWVEAGWNRFRMANAS